MFPKEPTIPTGQSAFNQPSGFPPQPASPPDALMQELQALRQWKQEATEFITDLMNQRGAQPASATPTLQGQAMPEITAEEAMAQIHMQTESQKLVEEMREKHADLRPFETTLILEAQNIAHQFAMQGQAITDKEAIEQAIKEFRQRLASVNKGQTNGFALQHMALQLGTGSAARSPVKPTPDEIFSMPPDQFEAFRAQLKNRTFQS